MAADFQTYYYGLLLLLIVAANWPFFVSRKLFWLPATAERPKHIGWYALELLLSFALVLAVGKWMEAQVVQPKSQDWGFYVVLFTLFLTLAFPGFVWRFLRKGL